MLLSRTIALFLLGCITTKAVIAGKYNFYSPDKKTTITVEVNQQITYRIAYNDQLIILPSAIAMILSDGEVLGKNAHVLSVKNKFVNNSLNSSLDSNVTLSETLRSNSTLLLLLVLLILSILI